MGARYIRCGCTGLGVFFKPTCLPILFDLYYLSDLRMQLLVLASLAAYASAHATWQEFWIGDEDAGNSCVRLPPSNSPVTDVSSAVCDCCHGFECLC